MPTHAANALNSPPIVSELRKAAILLASLPVADAAFLASTLDREQLDRLGQLAKSASPPSHAEQENLVREFVQSQAATFQQTPARSDESEPTRREVKNPFSQLTDATPERIASLLRDERPQTIAVVLAHLSPDLAAETLAAFSTEIQVAATLHIAHMQAPAEDVLNDLASTLNERVRRRLTPPVSPLGGTVHVARVLNQTDAATEKALLQNLAYEDRELVDDLARQLVIIRDLRRFDAAA